MFGLALFSSGPALADTCTQAGQISYRSGQLDSCDGSQWLDMKAQQLGTCGAAGSLTYSSSGPAFCDGAKLWSIAGTKGAACANNGNFVWADGAITICSGGYLFNANTPAQSIAAAFAAVLGRAPSAHELQTILAGINQATNGYPELLAIVQAVSSQNPSLASATDSTWTNSGGTWTVSALQGVGPPAVATFKDMQTLSRGQQLALVSLQGLANRGQARIYLYNSYANEDNDWIAQTIYSQWPAFQGAVAYTDFWKMISDFKGVANVQGVVVWDPSRPFTLNVATNLAGVKNLLMITPDLKAGAASLGLGVAYDLTTMFNDSPSLATNTYNAEKWAYDNFSSLYSTSWLADFYYYAGNDMERDYAIQNKIYTFWLPAPAATSASGSDDPDYSLDLTNYIGYVLQHTPMNTPILGWPVENDDQGVRHGLSEYAGVKWFGGYGKYAVGSDSASNYSFHSLMGSPTKSLVQTKVRTKARHTYDPTKKYVALMILDSGDAPCWFQYFFHTADWSDPDRGQVPISFSLSPQLQNLMPGLLPYLYRTATSNDYFFNGVSGLGYSFPLQGYGAFGVMAPGTATVTANQSQMMADFYQRTLTNMKQMDLDILGIYSTNQPWDTINYENWINTQLAPSLTGISALIADVGILPGMNASASSGLLANKIAIHHTLTGYPGSDGSTFNYGPWVLAQNPSLNLAQANAPNDAAAVNWMVNQIQQNSQAGNFIPAMAYSWMFGPHRLNLVRQQLESQGYVFVTLNEFNELWRQSKPTLPAANPDPWNKNGFSNPTQDDVELSVGRNAIASGVFNNDTSGTFAPAKAVDGDTGTYWASNTDGKPTWLLIDIGDQRLLSQASILWQSGGTYKIEVSSDGVNFALAATGTAGNGAWSTDRFASSWWGRWVRISPASSTDPQYRAIYHVDIRQ